MKKYISIIILVFLTTFLNAQNTLPFSGNSGDNGSDCVTSVSKQLNSIPEFPGGNKELHKYLTNNIRYPRNSKNSSTRGKVLVSFKVEGNGEITDVSVVEGVNKILNKEAKRVVNNMPNWNPAFENGIAISNVIIIPIIFLRN
jgi:protein TonB